jgi:hypothetical protein
MITGQIAPFFLFVRIAAAIGGALVGYFLSGPILRMLYRLAFQRPAPAWLLPLGKLCSGAIIGLLIFFFLPLGGGDGWGWGPGWGTGAGGDGGDGGSKAGKSKSKQIASTDGAVREKLDIELLGGKKYAGDERFYLVKRTPPAKTLSEVEELLKDNADKLEVHILLTDESESVARSHPAFRRLRDLLQRYRIPTVEPPEVSGASDAKK